ncbi:predicted protein, partial [Nematostella vectensis]
SYVSVLFVLFYLIPLFTMAFCYSRIYLAIQSLQVGAIKRWGTQLANKKTAKMAFVMTFLVAWTPYAVISFYSITGHARDLSFISVVLPAIFAKTSAFYNPIITLVFWFCLRDTVKL